MKAIRLFEWEDKARQLPVGEARVAQATAMNRNGVKRVYVWTEGNEHPNFMLYPDAGTAYPEFEERFQKQRVSRIYLYEPVE